MAASIYHALPISLAAPVFTSLFLLISQTPALTMWSHWRPSITLVKGFLCMRAPSPDRSQVWTTSKSTHKSVPWSPQNIVSLFHFDTLQMKNPVVSFRKSIYGRSLNPINCVLYISHTPETHTVLWDIQYSRCKAVVTHPKNKRLRLTFIFTLSNLRSLSDRLCLDFKLPRR